MSIESTQLLMESVIASVGMMEVAAVALAVFGLCLLAVAIIREASWSNEGAVLEEAVMERLSEPHAPNPHRFPASIYACIAVLISLSLLPSTTLAVPGDMNCDGTVSAADVPLFVQAQLATGSFGGCDINRADMNADTLINGLDTQAFAVALIAPTCPDGFSLCGGVCIDTWWDAGNCGDCQHICAPTEHCSFGSCESSCVGCEP